MSVGKPGNNINAVKLLGGSVTVASKACPSLLPACDMFFAQQQDADNERIESCALDNVEYGTSLKFGSFDIEKEAGVGTEREDRR